MVSHRKPGERSFGLTDQERFWSMVDKTPGLGPNGQCWEWTGTRNQKEYGRFWVNGRLESAHRYASIIAVGPILPDKPHVLHSCDHPPCVREIHLWRGTNLENAQDKARKHRARSRYQGGECNRVAKLTQLEAAQIRAFGILGISLSAIAKEYRVSSSNISKILNRRGWA